MKTDRYQNELERVTKQAQTKWDLERMLTALNAERLAVANRIHILKQNEFAGKISNKFVTNA